MIDVVSGVIIHSGRVLLTQRRGDKDFPYMWESPGGKVERGETHETAMARELDEEVGLLIAGLGDCIWSGEFNDPSVREDRRHVKVYMYIVRMIDVPTLNPRENQGIGWFSPGDMYRMNADQFAPANRKALDDIVRAVIDCPCCRRVK